MKHLYIHIPFCQRRCSYCDFNTYANMEHRVEAYVAALCSEIDARAQRRKDDQDFVSPSPCLPVSLSPQGLTRADLRPTIFLGGGTPTMLSLRQMERVLRAADRIVPLDGAEVTTEANPGTVIDETYLRGLRSLGINRISFGVQSLHDPTLRVLGRIHTAAEALSTYEQAVRAGFENINLDFIFGLPGQTAEQWAWTLDRLVEIAPQHVSLYSLIVEPGTPLHQQVTRGSISVPDDDATAEMYELAMDRLGAGYVQYEISNWARKETGRRGDEGYEKGEWPENSKLETRNSKLPTGACHHNLAYWLNADYLGCGAGAHGHVYPQRYHDILGVDAYIARAQQGELPIAETLELSEADLEAETMMMGLRLAPGVSRRHFRERCGRELDQAYGAEIAELVGLNMLESDDVGVRLTPRGRMLGNNVFMRFIRE